MGTYAIGFHEGFGANMMGMARAIAIGAVTNLKQKRCIQHKTAVKYAEDFGRSRTAKFPSIQLPSSRVPELRPAYLKVNI
jgi:hypothetical protein